MRVSPGGVCGWWLVPLLLVWVLAGPADLSSAETRPVALQTTTLRDFSTLPSISFPDVKPAFKEKNFPPQEAVNYREIRSLVGPLTPAQEEYLEKNRFLILPKPAFLMARRENRPPADEMLANFDALGGSLDPARREPANARFVGPDVILQAWRLYLANRLAAAEAGPLFDSTRQLLSDLLKNAAALKAGTSGTSARNWERLTAQLVVPLVLLESGGENPAGDDASPPDTAERTLARFEAYRARFSPAMAKNIRTELIRIHRADTSAAGLLGLTPAYPGELIDYTRFQPRGRYAGQPRLRAYYRAMAWLGDLGWSTRTEQGLADALNCALATSYDPAPSGPNGTDPTDPRAAWARVMEINTFFLGYPDSPSYLEWLPFLMKESEVPLFTADTGADEEVLRRLAAASDSIVPQSPHFRGLRPAGDSRVLCIFPRRLNLPALIAEELAQPARKGDPPAAFSALSLAALAGHQDARAMLPRQVALTRGLSETAEEIPPPDDPQKPTLLTRRLEALAARFKNEPEAAWLASEGAAWLRLAGTLSAEYGSGHPLYMRSRAFAVKQLETMLGSHAGLLHDGGAAALPPAADRAPAAKKEPPEPPAPLVKGLVEPNLAFWREMIRQVSYTQAGFRDHGLFPEDLADRGALRRFLKRLERCAALAEKELTGEDLTEDDYEFIRLFTLDWMAEPPDGAGGPRTDEWARSALAAKAQDVSPGDQSPGFTVYEAVGEPRLMLVLTGNEKSPRLVVGLVYSHYEFVGPHDRRLTDGGWRETVYDRHRPQASSNGRRPPAPNFWYDALRP